MPSIQLSLLLHHLLIFLKKLRIVRDNLWKLGIGQVSFLRAFFRRCLSLFIDRFRNLKPVSKPGEGRPSMPWGEANHDSHGVFGNVDCFSRVPTSLLPLHHAEHFFHQEPQMGPSTCQAVVPYSMAPTSDTLYPPEPQTSPSTCQAVVPNPITSKDDIPMSPRTSSSVTATAEDDRNCDPPELSKEISMLVGVTSYEFERYERKFKSKRFHYDSFTIRPMFMTFTEPELQNWVAFTHPDGALYFLDNSRTIPILTDVWMYDANSNHKLEDYITQIFSYIKKYEIEIPLETCLVLEFRNTGRCGYYFVNHTKQCLFWLDDFNGMDFLNEVKVEYTPSLVGHEMKSLYWLHNHLFPNIRPLPSGAISEIKDVLIHAVGDSLTSPRSLAPYSLDVLQKMLDLVNNIQAQDELAAGSISIISRFLHNFYHERFLHMHGQKIARLNRGQSIHPERKRTVLMTVISPFLLYGPEVYLKKLHEITLDYLVNSPVWENLLEQLTADWKEFTLYATVLLNANVAFLAIQSIDNAAYVGHRSGAQRASYFSTVTSVGAIVLGLLLVRQHNTSSLSLSFIANRSAKLETLALMYSLPYALLMWGMVSFLAAFSLMCFSSHDRVVIVMMSITWFTLCSLLIWCIKVSYESQTSWYPWPFRQWRWFKDSMKKGIMVGKGKIMHEARDDKLTSSLPLPS